MSLGAGIFLLAVGAILAFAVDIDVPGIDLTVVGYILMLAGVIGIILGIALLARRRQSVSTTRTGVDPVSGERVQRNVRSTDDTTY
jgi:membrane protein implicated in regulation of membrane protease activity